MKYVQYGIQVVQIVFFIIYITLYYQNKKIPYVTGEKSAFIGLFIIGFAMCTIGILTNLPKITWANPFMILAAIFGAVALAVSIIAILNKDILSLNNYKIAFNVLTVIIIAKWLITFAHRITGK